MEKANLYLSGEDHSIASVKQYSSTGGMPHRFLAYRDFPIFASRFKKGTALDFGSGTGSSVQYLIEQGYKVTGIDKSISMLEQAKASYPQVDFYDISEIKKLPSFGLVFSSFVLFELSSKSEIIEYLNLAADKMDMDGIFYGITGSEHLHCPDRKWLNFEVNHKENRELYSGKSVKLQLKDNGLLFSDYFWTAEDYLDCFKKSNLDLVRVHYPIASESDSFSWLDELSFPPFVVFAAKRKVRDSSSRAL